MSWTQADQDAATAALVSHTEQVNAAYEAWINSLQSGQQNQSQAALEEALRQWRVSIQQLRAQSDTLANNAGRIDMMEAIVKEISDQKTILKRLKSEAVTRGDQSQSVNPKITASPYTNLLGLQRTFRPATRTALLIVSIVFAVLTAAVGGWLVYSTLGAEGSSSSGGGSQLGGGRKSFWRFATL